MTLNEIFDEPFEDDEAVGDMIYGEEDSDDQPDGEEVQKFNPNHGPDGKFASSSSGASGDVAEMRRRPMRREQREDVADAVMAAGRQAMIADREARAGQAGRYGVPAPNPADHLPESLLAHEDQFHAGVNWIDDKVEGPQDRNEQNLRRFEGNVRNKQELADRAGKDRNRAFWRGAVARLKGLREGVKAGKAGGEPVIGPNEDRFAGQRYVRNKELVGNGNHQVAAILRDARDFSGLGAIYAETPAVDDPVKRARIEREREIIRVSVRAGHQAADKALLSHGRGDPLEFFRRELNDANDAAARAADTGSHQEYWQQAARYRRLQDHLGGLLASRFDEAKQHDDLSHLRSDDTPVGRKPLTEWVGKPVAGDEKNGKYEVATATGGAGTDSDSKYFGIRQPDGKFVPLYNQSGAFVPPRRGDISESIGISPAMYLPPGFQPGYQEQQRRGSWDVDTPIPYDGIAQQRFARWHAQPVYAGRETNPDWHHGGAGLRVQHMIDEAVGDPFVDAASAARWSDATKALMARMPRSAIEKFENNVQEIRYGTPDELKQHLFAGQENPDGTIHNIAGYYDMKDRRVGLDGDEEAAVQAGLRLERGDDLNAQAYVIGAVLNRSLGPGRLHCFTTEWGQIHDAEFADGQLCRNATDSLQESFQEFARVAILDPTLAKEKFPKAYQYWKGNGLA